MSAIWFEAAIAETRPDACWELYHENSKLDRRLALDDRRQRLPAADDTGDLPVFPLGEPGLPTAVAAAAAPNAQPPPMTSRALSGLLAAASLRFAGADPVEVYLYAGAVETLPRGLFRYDPEIHALRLLHRDDDLGEAIERLLVAPAEGRPGHATIFLVGDLERATAWAGERGYRQALIAAGRHLQALATAASAANITLVEIEAFYDRDIDALLFLDGLARSILSIAAVGPASG
jgi:SagB-type dehydrogenase family enzyme